MSKIKSFISDTEKVFTFLSICILFTWVFWGYLNSIFLILLFLYWLFFVNKTFPKSKSQQILLYLFLAYYAFVIAGYFYSDDKSLALTKIQKKVPFVLLPLIFSTTPDLSLNYIHKCFRASAWALVCAIAVFLIRGFYIFLQTGDKHFMYGYDMVFIEDTYPYILGFFGLLFLNYFFYSFQKKLFETKNKRIIYTIISVVVIAFIILIATRNIFIGVVLLVLYYSFFIFKSIKLRFFIVSSLIITIIAAVSFIPSFHRQWKEMKEKFIYTDIKNAINNSLEIIDGRERDWGGWVLRQGLWYCSKDIIKDHWLFGVGTGDAQTELVASYEKYHFYFASRKNSYNSHNQYIQQIITSGIFSLIILLSLIFFPLIYFWKNRLIRFYLFAILLLFFTEAFLEFNKGIVLFSFYSSILFFNNKRL